MSETDPNRRMRIARQHVQTDQLLGIASVPQGEAAAPPPLDETAEPAPAPAAAAPTDSTTASTEPSGAVPTGSPWSAAPELDRAARQQLLEQMDRDEVSCCTKCPLSEGRTRTVFGEGDPDARIMFIGEGPGQNEDEQGRPFVGRAGELLNKQIAAMGLEREQVFIANVVKCRPPNNRAPTPAEVDACEPYLRRQIQGIRPDAIITLGGPATKLILDTKLGITRLRGTWATYDGLLPTGPQVPVMPTFHPAYLLRSYTEDNRRRVWSDLQQVMERLGMK